MKADFQRYAAWCRSPWGLIILVVLAVAFGGHLAMGGNPVMTISTGVMLFSHLTLSLMSFRESNRKKAHKKSM